MMASGFFTQYMAAVAVLLLIPRMCEGVKKMSPDMEDVDVPEPSPHKAEPILVLPDYADLSKGLCNAESGGVCAAAGSSWPGPTSTSSLGHAPGYELRVDSAVADVAVEKVELKSQHDPLPEKESMAAPEAKVVPERHPRMLAYPMAVIALFAFARHIWQTADDLFHLSKVNTVLDVQAAAEERLRDTAQAAAVGTAS
mmetsp:Transcript_37903/g.85526  ORF Transcript_37903/g.85526 Transcript_37903/m.85526 type:complete len:198 (+) Transcript_37903:95-688(+)